jgi:mono/diheme cytochrome c family protein
MRLARRIMNVALAASAVVWAAAVAGIDAQAPARTVNDGVYSSGQATRGEALFQSICTTCHAPDRFTGKEFVSGWSGKPLSELFKAVQTMPEDNPGSLNAQQYADVMAYFLRLNNFPSGPDELKGDAEVLATIGVEPPKPGIARLQ